MRNCFETFDTELLQNDYDLEAKALNGIVIIEMSSTCICLTCQEMEMRNGG